ncbi:MAG: uracil-DNA glycosylase [Eubacteriales bacterium]|nr:uracil-DNA glycosylase [Eubacteriales bacterium]MDD4390609.1 uracil-DNA glycosylase [Eubacteriales bacterium]
MINIGNDWDALLAEEFDKDYYKELRAFLVKEYRTSIVYPDMYDIFNAFKYTPYSDVKAVILGQDPYHRPGEAHGLCFSVKKGISKPPSLLNIYKEMNSDIGTDMPSHGFLGDWASEGVLLLNTVLTVRHGQANSHKGRGWECFTDRVIELLNERERPIVFILWGANAKSKRALITNPQHYVLTGAHPSPLSAHNGFFGGKYFSETNKLLIEKGIEPIDWNIKE